jgi:hypothetical protein
VLRLGAVTGAWDVGAAGVLKPLDKQTLSGDWACILGVRRLKCEAMHDLRKAIREARYALEAVQTARPLAAAGFDQALTALVSTPSDKATRAVGLLGSFLWSRPGLCQCRFREAI